MRSSIVISWKRAPEILFIGAFFVLDQMIKHRYQSSARFVCNKYGPWGVEIGTFVLIPIIIILLVILMFVLGRESDIRTRIPLAFIIAGGLGNLVDRICFGCVRDMTVFSWFPAFNVADVVLSIGALLIMMILIKKKRR